MFHAVVATALALAFGDPSRSGPHAAPDSIYALAVDPSKYAVEAFIYLLDDGVIRLEPDGRASRTYRQVIQILKRVG